MMPSSFAYVAAFPFILAGIGFALERQRLLQDGIRTNGFVMDLNLITLISQKILHQKGQMLQARFTKFESVWRLQGSYQRILTTWIASQTQMVYKFKSRPFPNKCSFYAKI